MGISDMLIKMGIRYGSEESISICDYIAYRMAKESIYASSILGEVYGSFPKCNLEQIKSTDFFKNHIDKPDEIQELRNSQLLTIAPTGTLSTMLGVSGGIEPIFANSYTRMTKSLYGKDVEYKVYTPIVDKYMKEHKINDEKDLPDYFVTAQQLDYYERIAMQAVWQNHIDASISSTVNLPNSATKEDVFNLYIVAWKAGLKGITIFRDGCNRTAILNTSTDTKKKNEEVKHSPTVIPRGAIIETDNNVVGLKRKLITGCGSLHCLAFFDPVTGDLLETYLNKGSTGGCNNFMIGLSRMISLLVRAGVDIETIVDQLNSCGSCPSYASRTATKHDTSKGSCCPMAIGNALLDMYEEMQRMIKCDDEDSNTEDDVEITENSTSNNSAKCPICGDPLIFEGGCISCKGCGWSKCE